MLSIEPPGAVGIFNQFLFGNTDISNNFLDDSLEHISEKKENHPLCEKCISYGLPAYNLGVNRKGWDELAKQKISEKKIEL